ncbi:GNAT family N-acetyltransferase [Streptomyces sp. WAC06614]|uniref:GNAT family N-acetyltransferase n=1 Tax=Streptomyces sp. WAC06614 TaxID=2487416 RepID=UPI0021AFCE1A|nr:GNAT family N-acetyltransferase [Streptomyces sp. WAC06614]
MTEADVDAVSGIRVRGWQAAYVGLVPQAYLDGMTVEDDARLRRARCTDPGATACDLVADDGNGPLGWASYGPYRGEGVPGGVGELYALYVRPDVIGQGVGRTLLAAVQQRAVPAGFGSLALWVLRDNTRARRFYEAAGYTADGGEQSDDYDGVALTEVRYRRPLK